LNLHLSPRYPPGYGFAKCFEHDTQLAPFCADENGGELVGAPSWCYQQFCYVDKNNCDMAYEQSHYFSQDPLYYSCPDGLHAHEGPGVQAPRLTRNSRPPPFRWTVCILSLNGLTIQILCMVELSLAQVAFAPRYTTCGSPNSFVDFIAGTC
jgi:hypothetical protein